VLTYLGVAGWPVGHSRSPAMHNAALAAVGLADWRYLRLPLPPARFAETVRALPAAGFRGINVTIPHKEAALALATSATETARAVGATTPLPFGADGGVHADNTDVPFKDAKQKLVDEFTRDYVAALLAKCNGNVSHTALKAGVARSYIQKLVAKYGLKSQQI